MKWYKKRQIVSSAVLLCVSLLLFLSACGTSDSFEKHVRSGNYADAISLYRDKISGNSTKELDAKNFLLEYIQKTLTDYASGEIDDQSAESVFDCLLKIDDELYILNVELGYSLEQLTVLQMSKEDYEAAIVMENNGDYESAASLFASVDESDTQNYTSAITHLESCYTAIYEETNSSIDNYISENEFELAINTYDHFNQAHSDLVTDDMIGKFGTCVVEYRKQIVEDSIESYHASGAEAADAVINRGLQVLSGDNQLINVSNLYQSVTEPVSFKSLTGRENGVGLNGVSKRDSLGNDHSSKNLIYFFYLSSERKVTSIERNTYGSYTLLSGSMYFLDTDYDMAASMTIYADGKSIFESGPMNKKTGGTDFNVDITDAYSVKIEISYVDGPFYSPCFLDNVFVSRVLTDEEIYQAMK